MKKVIINEHIVANPQICHGKPTFKGTRIMVWQIDENVKAILSRFLKKAGKIILL